MSRRSARAPLYPTLLAAAALALTGAACGPEEQLVDAVKQSITNTLQPVDAGSPNQEDFIGGAAPAEMFLPDGGRR